MSTLPQTITDTRLWRQTLAEQADDPYRTQRERLRANFVGFRERCGHLASEIRKDLPDLTVHDLTHLDALWEIADTIVGESYYLTPAEGFVLGGAILLHDLAMSVAAIPGGYQQLIKDARWADLVSYEYRNTQGRNPSPEEIKQPIQEISERALFNLLRQEHAKNAEVLASISFSSSSGTPIFLIEDTEIRVSLGRVIGQVAHSHWWSLSDVDKAFSRIIGAPPWCPREWKIDPLKLACILRTADASHLDARRAPTFLKAISRLSASSEEHWAFQEKLNKPYTRPNDDALFFTSGHAFSLNEASSWWLCLETLRVADRELRSVDALFADRGYPRLVAKRVAGVDSPERLATYIPTNAWLPINATVHVTDLPKIISSLGGEELYGKKPQTAIRELVQNACDAVRARRTYQDLDVDWGKVTVSLTERVPEEYWLEVRDNGIGMSQRVLSDFLLDFGQSFWSSPFVYEEFPGLLSSNLEVTGKFGIGFYSVFMVSEDVKVVTRRCDRGVDETLVLEFSSGLSKRPILRVADKHEQMIDGGTFISLKLNKSPYAKGGLLSEEAWRYPVWLRQACLKLCPALDVSLYVIENNNDEEKVISANDWRLMDGADFLFRLGMVTDFTYRKEDRISKSESLRFLINEEGEVVGRAFVCPSSKSAPMTFEETLPNPTCGIMTVGGLHAGKIKGLFGIILARPLKASRQLAVPIATGEILKDWASTQEQLVPALWEPLAEQFKCAERIRSFGGKAMSLPVCYFQGQWLSGKSLAEQLIPDTIFIPIASDMFFHFTQGKIMIINPDVIITLTKPDKTFETGQSDLINWPRYWDTESPWLFKCLGEGTNVRETLAGAVIDSLALAWNVPAQSIIDANHFRDEQRMSIGTWCTDGIKGQSFKTDVLEITRPSV